MQRQRQRFYVPRLMTAVKEEIKQCFVDDERGRIYRMPASLRLVYEPLHRYALIRLRLQVAGFNEPFFLYIEPGNITRATYAMTESPGLPVHLLFDVKEVDLVASSNPKILLDDPRLKQLRRLAQQPVVRIHVPDRDSLPDLEAFCHELNIPGITTERIAADLKTLYRGEGGRVINYGDRPPPPTRSLIRHVDQAFGAPPPSYPVDSAPTSDNATTSNVTAPKSSPRKRPRTGSSPRPSSSPPPCDKKSPDKRGDTDSRRDANKVSKRLRKMIVQEQILRNLSAEIDMKREQVVQDLANAARVQEEREKTIRELLSRVDRKQALLARDLEDMKALQAKFPNLYAQSLLATGGEDRNDDGEDSTSSPTSTACSDNIGDLASQASVETAGPPRSQTSTLSVDARALEVPKEVKAYVDQEVARVLERIIDHDEKLEEVDRSVDDIHREWNEATWDEEVWDAIDKSADVACDRFREKLLYSGIS